jgi:hypothetical protein
LLDADRSLKGKAWNATTTHNHRRHSFMFLRFDSTLPHKSSLKTKRSATKTTDNIADKENHPANCWRAKDYFNQPSKPEGEAKSADSRKQKDETEEQSQTCMMRVCYGNKAC